MPGIGKDRIGRKIGKLRREGKSAAQAAGQAFGMARDGSLGGAAKIAARRGKRGTKPPKQRLETDQAAVKEYTRGS